MTAKVFNETVFICDRNMHWVSLQVRRLLDHLKIPVINLSSDTPLRSAWSRIHNTPKIIIHWECKDRIGGAIIEELLEISPKFDIDERLIVITSETQAEDEVYFKELGIHNVVYMPNMKSEIKNGLRQIKDCLLNPSSINVKREKLWRKVLHSLDLLRPGTDPDLVERISQQIEKAGILDQHQSARYFYGKGLLAHFSEGSESAEDFYKKALGLDANYYPAKLKMIELMIANGSHRAALDSLRMLQRRNKNNISRLVKIGEIHQQLNDAQKGEHYYRVALSKDANCGSALNGLATLRFEQGRLEESRDLLAKSATASKVASTLNQKGIHLVKQEKYEEALSHYSKAQYVLPQQDKSPMLFYNMGLCYSRWGKVDMAKQFLQLALIKEPNYKKARRLLEQITPKAI